MTSVDGINWNGFSTTSNQPWSYIVWSAVNSLFVVVGTAGNCVTSPDGETWTSRSGFPFTANPGVAASDSLDLFVSVSISGTNPIRTSPDGINWTAHAAYNVPNTESWQAILWSESLGLFVAVASSSSATDDRVMTSPDGVTWTPQTAALTASWQALAESPSDLPSESESELPSESESELPSESESELPSESESELPSESESELPSESESELPSESESELPSESESELPSESESELPSESESEPPIPRAAICCVITSGN
jgi:hypothetical protein